MFALLEDVLRRFQKCLAAQDQTCKKVIQETEEWLLSEDSNYVFSFSNICDVLGLSPALVRKAARQWKQKQMIERDKKLPRTRLNGRQAPALCRQAACVRARKRYREAWRAKPAIR